MPGNISAAAPSTTLPWNLASSFQRATEYPILLSEYKAGEYDHSVLGEIGRNVWDISWAHLTPTDVAELRAFYLARKGGLEPFYFYDVTEPNAGAYDETGASTTSRYIVRFDGAWDQATGMAFSSVGLKLVEVA